VGACLTGRTIELTAGEGHVFSAYEAAPQGAARGALVVLQEIFGVTPHIRFVCDRYASHGYRALAPALYDRLGRDIVMDYSKEGGVKARELRGKVPWDQVLADTAASIAHLAQQGDPVATVGFCWGGTAAWLAATCLSGVAASVSYYPTHLGNMVEEAPRSPVLIHLGETDHITSLTVAGALRARHGAILELQVYPCGHGFDCNDREDFHAESAALAHERTLAFLARHLK
jgi:carboxymethylenebutenolidase